MFDGQVSVYSWKASSATVSASAVEL